MKTSAEKSKKTEFTNLLGSIWCKSFTIENIVQASKKQECPSPNREVYPIDGFNPEFLHAYRLFREEMAIQASVRNKASTTDESANRCDTPEP